MKSSLACLLFLLPACAFDASGPLAADPDASPEELEWTELSTRGLALDCTDASTESVVRIDGPRVVYHSCRADLVDTDLATAIDLEATSLTEGVTVSVETGILHIDIPATSFSGLEVAGEPVVIRFDYQEDGEARISRWSLDPAVDADLYSAVELELTGENYMTEAIHVLPRSADGRIIVPEGHTLDVRTTVTRAPGHAIRGVELHDRVSAIGGSALGRCMFGQVAGGEPSVWASTSHTIRHPGAVDGDRHAFELQAGRGDCDSGDEPGTLIPVTAKYEVRLGGTRQWHPLEVDVLGLTPHYERLFTVTPVVHSSGRVIRVKLENATDHELPWLRLSAHVRCLTNGQALSAVEAAVPTTTRDGTTVYPATAVGAQATLAATSAQGVCPGGRRTIEQVDVMDARGFVLHRFPIASE